LVDEHARLHVDAGIQAFEMMAIAAVGNNLITYVFGEMHFPLSEAANIVTNFIGTVFLLSLLGGFLSDSYLGSFWTMLIFGFVELSVILNKRFIINLIIITYLDASIIIIT
jgi:dipeptide/tripeptide permease